MDTEHKKWLKRVVEVRLRAHTPTGEQATNGARREKEEEAQRELSYVLSAAPKRTWLDTLSEQGNSLFVAVCVGVCVWIYVTTPHRDPPSKFELQVAGAWQSIVLNRHLYLRLDKHKALLTDQAGTDELIVARGAWRVEGKTVVADLSGAAGNHHYSLELLENGEQVYLAPTPAELALLKDCWIAEPQYDESDDSFP